jgi:anti-anti-sigma factor
VVRLYGELCMASAPRLLDLTRSLEFQHLVLDMAGLTLCDSSGINFLIRLQERCDSALRRLTLANASEPVLRVLQVAGVDHLFDMSWEG